MFNQVFGFNLMLFETNYVFVIWLSIKTVIKLIRFYHKEKWRWHLTNFEITRRCYSIWNCSKSHRNAISFGIARNHIALLLHLEVLEITSRCYFTGITRNHSALLFQPIRALIAGFSLVNNSSRRLSRTGGGCGGPTCFNIGYSDSARAESRERSSALTTRLGLIFFRIVLDSDWLTTRVVLPTRIVLDSDWLTQRYGAEFLSMYKDVPNVYRWGITSAMF